MVTNAVILREAGQLIAPVLARLKVTSETCPTCRATRWDDWEGHQIEIELSAVLRKLYGLADRLERAG